MKTIKKLIGSLLFLMFISCADYLDIVPDDVPSMDKVFTNRVNAEKFYFTCYSYLPNPTAVWSNPALIGGDEIWWNIDQPNFVNNNATLIAFGNQNTNDPYQNFWDGRLNGTNLFIAIRDCNIFLENIHLPPDLGEEERNTWIAEVKFLKAYYHFYLLRLYGPIPIVRENILVSASPEEVRVHREPVDKVVEYIAELIDEAMPGLPPMIEDLAAGLGRITQPIALAVKAQAYVWAASPLFNGNGDYTNFKDNRGIQLISTEYDVSKWEKAAKAIKEAIDSAESNGHGFYHFQPIRQMSEETQKKFELRYAVTEKYNREIIWPSTHDVVQLARYSMPRLVMNNAGFGGSEICATLKVAEQFYSKNGIPIDEDPEWDYTNRYEQQVAGEDHEYYIKTGQTTALLNYNREPRFYAYMGFDRGILEGAGRSDESNSWYIQARKGEAGGFRSVGEHIPTGYFLKKMIHPDQTLNESSTAFTSVRYTYPIIRLSDLYLLYAEALNEIKAAPDEEVYYWIDVIRERAGLKGVVESWNKSSVRVKPNSKEGMREIIKNERLIELCFEGQRFYDLRRWKDALKYLNEPVRGWNYQGEDVESYYRIVTYWNKRVFNTRDYLWPLKISTLAVNDNLLQNPGWK